MVGTSCNPFFEGWDLFRSFICCGSEGSRSYAQRERIEYLEKMKNRPQQELSGIEELIEDLKKADAK